MIYKLQAIGKIVLQSESTIDLCKSLGNVVRERATVNGNDSNMSSVRNGVKQFIVCRRASPTAF